MSNRANFEALLAQGHDNAMLRYSLGNACMSETQFADAIEHLNRAVEMDPQYSAAWKILGKCHEAEGRYQQAVDSWDAGIAAAEEKGDKQAQKEMQVFRKRALKKLDQP